MEELEFLLEGDKNILEAEICDVETKKGTEVGISLTIGKSDEQCAEIVSKLKESEPTPTFEAFEIVLTKRELNKILKLMKEY